MIAALPSRIMDYDVSPSSPSEELVTVGEILAEVGDYASTILDRVHQSFSSRCAAKLAGVMAELRSRGRVPAPETHQEQSSAAVGAAGEYVTVEDVRGADLSAMTVGELYTLYRAWPSRHEQRLREGREHLTYYYEGKIVAELKRRKAATMEEQLKIDYCEATYANELDNLSFILSCPVDGGGEKIYPSPDRDYTAGELTELIRRYTHYKDVMERELLIEYVDKAIDRLCQPDAPEEAARESSLELAALRAATAALADSRIIALPHAAVSR